MRYRFLADMVVAIHALYVALRRLRPRRDSHRIRARLAMGPQPYFRILHLVAILFVCAESIIGIDCPLTDA